ncbi:2Fe-2S iron-sulfur cluster binding domain-containing protein [Cyanobacterium stanieri LEGE 03274]|uniref:2Fe-2S iron-sulfur cluster binding domain-containing protein n=1 Tax=Cyanobacterium stanieri LEGE 03274 TaxID=1828756 RepID=A0ABR9V4U5_9CHRO|nr:2Fe-2S iron-sulfur cluster-binding protein [Cyanobacterium stanieri]MBE9222898.1 2Fe-2S iron-sulfur cluster binding domain-containing protein [Cyanobacterium stanieri LEGE 03274]
MTIKIKFLPDNITTEAEAGEPILEVASRAGVFIPTGCLMGSCHACEVEIGPEGEEDIICACISAVPAGEKELIINVYSDPVW